MNMNNRSDENWLSLLFTLDHSIKIREVAREQKQKEKFHEWKKMMKSDYIDTFEYSRRSAKVRIKSHSLGSVNPILSNLVINDSNKKISRSKRFKVENVLEVADWTEIEEVINCRLTWKDFL